MGIFWRLSALLVAACLWIPPASAQIPGGGGVSQQGSVTAGNCTKWISTGIIADAGSACGGSGSPGGSNTQVQYNNSGSFGGITGATTNGTALTLVAPVLGTPASATLTNATGLPVSTGLTGAGTGVLTALGVNVGTAGAFVVNGGALGTPSSGIGTNLTGTAAGLTAGNVTTNANLTGAVTSSGNATSLGSFSSAQLLSALSTSTGTGVNVFGTAPTISSPTINTAMTLGFLTGAGTECMQVSNTGVVSGTGSACGGSGSTGANPTATAGPTAVSGSATTFLRSDGAPAVQKATNAQFGIVEGDTTTITCIAGVCSTVNTGTVTSVATACGATGGAITATGTIKASVTASSQTGANYAFQDSDCGKLINLSNASNQIPTIAAAGSGSLLFSAGGFVQICNQGAGTQTITPTTSTIGGASTYVLRAASAGAPVCIAIVSDGTNYQVVPDAGFGTLSGAVKASSGQLSQAACADLSNGATGCSTATGTSGGTLPLLNGTNTWSGVQTFGNVFGTVSTQSGTTYTLASTDCGTEVVFTNASAVTVTIPAALTTGCNIAILQTTSAGQVTVTGTAVSAATLHSAHSYTKTFGQWAVIGINIYTTGVAILTGDGA